MEDTKFRYVHEPSDSIDVHRIELKRRHSSSSLRLLPLLIILILSISPLFAKKIRISSWYLGFLLTGLLVKVLLRNHVHQESLVIIPDFGVQLETHYRRKVVRCFIPIGNILQPVLNECVTPVTCYWSLSLIIRGEGELLLAFKELRPPVKMLVPVWKALCSTINRSDSQKKSSYLEMDPPVEEGVT